MIDTRTAEPAEASPALGWDPERRVFIFPEGCRAREVRPGVALAGPNGQRVPERKPIVICDPARLSPRRRCNCMRQLSALKTACLVVISVALGFLVLLAAASCIGSF